MLNEFNHLKNLILKSSYMSLPVYELCFGTAHLVIKKTDGLEGSVR